MVPSTGRITPGASSPRGVAERPTRGARALFLRAASRGRGRRGGVRSLLVSARAAAGAQPSRSVVRLRRWSGGLRRRAGVGARRADGRRNGHHHAQHRPGPRGRRPPAHRRCRSAGRRLCRGTRQARPDAGGALCHGPYARSPRRHHGSRGARARLCHVRRQRRALARDPAAPAPTAAWRFHSSSRGCGSACTWARPTCWPKAG